MIMSSLSRSHHNGFRPKLALRFAVRELRGGLSGFYVFIACLALGVGAIAGVNSLAYGLKEGIAREGRSILGGDIDFSLIHRQANEREKNFLKQAGSVSTVATLRAMARKDNGTSQALVEVKAIDDAYPLYGALKLEDDINYQQALRREKGRYGALIDSTLLARLDLNIGDSLNLGKAHLFVAGIIQNEPDSIASGVGFGPRLMLSLEALQATSLVQPGSLVRWHYRIRLTKNGNLATAKAMQDAAKDQFPEAGWRIRLHDNASPGLASMIDRFAHFLTLVGLTALIVGGVGVANAVRSFLDTKRPVIATFKCLGASGNFIFVVYLIQICLLAAIGILIGLAIGALLPLIGGNLLRYFLPIPVALSLYPGELALAALYGLLSALAFALWPLGQSRDVAPTALFRDQIAQSRSMPRFGYIAATFAILILLATLAIIFADSKYIASIYIGAVIVAFILLYCVSYIIMGIAKHAPHMRSAVMRLAIGNIHRKGALTPSVVLSLGLGLSLLIALTLIDGNLRRQITSTLPDKAPSFFFIDIQNAIVDEFASFVKTKAPNAVFKQVPMLRGRIISLAGTPADQITPDPDVAWVLRGDRGITYDSKIPSNSTVVEGKWWPKNYQGEPLVSMDVESAEGLGLNIGDHITVNVLGRNITARLANLRVLEWTTLGINFVMVFSPNTFAGAPHTHLATLAWDDGTNQEQEFNLLKNVINRFPAITAIRVKDALDTVNNIVIQLAWAIRGASSITLIISILVLGGALAAGHRHRVYDAVILKTLGATRVQLITAFAIEYALLGLATIVFALIAGGLAAWFVLENVMEAEFTFLPGTALLACLPALLLTLVFGLIGTWRLLGFKAAPLLRNL